jgi:MoxR-like ATPase
MTQELDYIYTGKILPERPKTGSRGQKRYPYLPEDDLVEAVNLSIALERPLLLEGDPGCGKTCLAEAIVYELNQKNKVEIPFYRWDVKSSTRGRDGLYTFDAVGRLRDAQMLGANLSQLEKFLDQEDFKTLKTRLKDKEKYIEFGALGQAIQEESKRAIVLIDEVDKADSDFANDLLLELDRFEFTVPELNNQSYPENPQTAPKPIVILTSN